MDNIISDFYSNGIHQYKIIHIVSTRAKNLYCMYGITKLKFYELDKKTAFRIMAMLPTKITAFGIVVAAALAVGVVAPSAAYAISLDDLKNFNVDDDLVNQTILQNSEQFQVVETNADDNSTALTDAEQSNVQLASNTNNDNDSTTQED